MIDRAALGSPYHKPYKSAIWATKIAGGLNMVAGAWLIIAPFFLGYAHMPAPATNDVIVGLIVLCAACMRIANLPAWPGLSWINIIAGLWLMIAPFALHYADATAPLWNDLTMGVIIFILAVVGRMIRQQPRAVN